jgi:hypothetical protein
MLWDLQTASGGVGMDNKLQYAFDVDRQLQYLQAVCDMIRRREIKWDGGTV